MFAYVMRRLAVAIPTLLLLIVFSFVLMHLAPGGPFTQERALPPQVIANLNAKYGLDEPLWRQIINYIYGIVVHFDFGPSFVYPDRTVNELIAAGFPVTLTYGTLSFIAAVVLGWRWVSLRPSGTTPGWIIWRWASRSVRRSCRISSWRRSWC